jgi:hypothetical protein
VRARLLRLHSPDADSLQEYVPEDPEAFGLLVQAMVGPEDSEGEESFDFVVCTARWFAAQPFDKGFAWPRHHLFLNRWDYSTLERAISDGPENNPARRWGRRFHWNQRWAAKHLARIGIRTALEPLRAARARDPLGRWIYSRAISAIDHRHPT